MTTTYRLIGKGTTSNGVATMTKKTSDGGSTWTDCNGYTGTGKGITNIVASVDNPTTVSSVQSAPYILWDCVVYDSCTLADSSKTTFDALSSASVFTRYSDYGALTEATTGTTATLSLSSLSSPCTVDFELKGVDGSAGSVSMDLYGSGGYKSYVTLSNLGYGNSIIGEWVNLRMTLDEGTVTVTSLDDPTKTVTKNYTGTVNNIRWNTGGDNTEIHIRNLKVY